MKQIKYLFQCYSFSCSLYCCTEILANTKIKGPFNPTCNRLSCGQGHMQGKITLKIPVSCLSIPTDKQYILFPFVTYRVRFSCITEKSKFSVLSKTDQIQMSNHLIWKDVLLCFALFLRCHAEMLLNQKKQFRVPQS